MTHLKFKSVASDRWFYDRWQRCIKFYLPEVSAIRGLPERDEIEKILHTRQKWRNDVRHRWPGLNTFLGQDGIDQSQMMAVLDFADFLRKHDTDYKMVISVSWVWIYSNNLELIQKIQDLSYVKQVQLTEAVITRPRDCVVLKKSTNQWRSYFRSQRLDSEQKHSLKNFLQNQQDVRTSTALQQWLDTHYARSQDYYFVDHNGGGFEIMLNLVAPNIIRKTLPIVAK